jgi:hypothetical protein
MPDLPRVQYIVIRRQRMQGRVGGRLLPPVAVCDNDAEFEIPFAMGVEFAQEPSDAGVCRLKLTGANIVFEEVD